jgi:hypothetical protein
MVVGGFGEAEEFHNEWKEADGALRLNHYCVDYMMAWNCFEINWSQVVALEK